MRANRLHVKLGTPEHGWLPVKVIAPDFKLEFNASNVPVNSIELFISALILALGGVESEVPWFLEPNSYLFKFGLKENGFTLKVEYKDDYGPASGLKYEVYGDFQSIILPFYRAIKSFASYHYTKPDWPEIDPRSISKLSGLIRGRKLVSRA